MDQIHYYKGNVKIDTTIEVVQNEMAQFLQMDRLSFLLGAGCSSNIIEGKEMGIPGMRVLYDSFFESNPEFEIAGKHMYGEYDGNLEKMLEAMGAVQVANQIKTIDKEIDNKILLVQSFLRNRIRAGINSDSVKDIYKTFIPK